MTNKNNETKIFIGGSRRLSRLNQHVKQRIDNIVDKGFTIMVGDANGVDKAVQQYLCERQDAKALVFCMEGGCRNNIGRWPTRMITASRPTRKDFAYYSAKDRAMAEEADYGFMLWDGRSRGTLTNVVHLVRCGKPVLLYTAPSKAFRTLHGPHDLKEVLEQLDPGIARTIDRDLDLAIVGDPSHQKKLTASLF